MLKRLILAFALLGMALAARGAETCSAAAGRPDGELPTCKAIDAAVADTTSTTITAYGYKYLSLTVKAVENPGLTTAVVNIECRDSTDDQWHECSDDIIDPDNTSRTDQAVNLSRANYYRISTTGHLAGTITVYFTRSRE